MIRKTKHIKGVYFAIAMIANLLYSCSSTKYVPDDRYLLNDLKITVDNSEIDKNEIKSYLRQEENLQILGFLKFHLGLYNLSSKKKEYGWLKRIGEAPVIYDKGLTEKSRQQLTQYLKNKGYNSPRIEIKEQLKDRKINIEYLIEAGAPLIIREKKVIVKDDKLIDYIQNAETQTLVKEGNLLDRDVLGKERDRISRYLWKNGFYRFDPEYIHYIAKDTSLLNNQTDLEMHVEPYYDINKQSIESHKQFKVQNISFYLSFDDDNSSGNRYRDTLIVDGISFLFSNKIPINPKTLLRALQFRKQGIYNIEEIEKTNNTLLALKQFKFIRINFDEIEGIDNDYQALDCSIYLSMLTLQNTSVDLEGTNTSGDLGVAGNIKYQHRNVLHSAEILDIGLKLARERQLTKENTIFNTTEYGAESKITVPRFLIPLAKENRLLKNSIPKTTFSISYNYQRRPAYTRTIANSKIGYTWSSSEKKTHFLNLLDLNVVRIFEQDEEWINSIKDLYIKSSYTNHVISGTSYSYVFNPQSINKQNDYDYLRVNFESAGNLLYAANSLLGNNPFVSESDDDPQESYYRLFGTRFAQYVRGDVEYRRGIKFDKYNSLAFRSFAGVALPFGNTSVMPFEKRYFTGGANGIRAWQVRTLGPGSYKSEEDQYPNQSADIKLEANIEYRFKLFWLLEGALFLDAGNIWSIRNYENSQEATFMFDRFYKEIAVGTGFGTRLVTKYFIIRADVGMKLRDPSEELGQRFIPLNRGITNQDFNFNIAIGYPF